MASSSKTNGTAVVNMKKSAAEDMKATLCTVSDAGKARTSGRTARAMSDTGKQA
jgi:hypothetical protein